MIHLTTVKCDHKLLTKNNKPEKQNKDKTPKTKQTETKNTNKRQTINSLFLSDKKKYKTTAMPAVGRNLHGVKIGS